MNTHQGEGINKKQELTHHRASRVESGFPAVPSSPSQDPGIPEYLPEELQNSPGGGGGALFYPLSPFNHIINAMVRPWAFESKSLV